MGSPSLRWATARRRPSIAGQVSGQEISGTWDAGWFDGMDDCVGFDMKTQFGMPIFAAIGGAALILFWGDATPINAVPGETYRLTTSTMLPAVPLWWLDPVAALRVE